MTLGEQRRKAHLGVLLGLHVDLERHHPAQLRDEGIRPVYRRPTCILNGNCSPAASGPAKSLRGCCVPRRRMHQNALFSELLRAKRLEFFSAGLTEVTQNIDGIAVDHLL